MLVSEAAKLAAADSMRVTLHVPQASDAMDAGRSYDTVCNVLSTICEVLKLHGISWDVHRGSEVTLCTFWRYVWAFAIPITNCMCRCTA